MTSYVNSNSNVIKSYVKKQEKRKEKIILPNENNRFQEIIITIMRARRVHQSNFDSFLINKNLSIKVYQ